MDSFPAVRLGIIFYITTVGIHVGSNSRRSVWNFRLPHDSNLINEDSYFFQSFIYSLFIRNEYDLVFSLLDEMQIISSDLNSDPFHSVILLSSGC